MTIIEAAEALGVTRATLSGLVNGKRRISAEMAVRLSKVFRGSAEGWLAQQAHYDLAQVRGDRIRQLGPAGAGDDFGQRLRALRGTVPKDIDLEL